MNNLSTATDASVERKRAYSKPGERRVQILQALAEMLEHPKGEKITTAALAARLDVSEAALYRHFASKAQMYEGLIEFIETTIFNFISNIAVEHSNQQPGAGRTQARETCAMLLRFSEQNRGMTRVLIGDALVGENERLQERMNQLYERIETALKQSLKNEASSGAPNELNAAARANAMVSYVVGKWHRFAKSGWTVMPTEEWEAQIAALLR